MNKAEKWRTISQYAPIFTKLELNLSFLPVTNDYYNRSKIHTLIPVKKFLKDNNIHDYSKQDIGQEKNGVIYPAKLILSNTIVDLETSLYIEKRGDKGHGKPKIWFRKIKNHIKGECILALIYKDNKLLLLNLNDENTKKSLFSKDYVYEVLKSQYKLNPVADELFGKIKQLHSKDVKSVYSGCGSVGETLEHALGIKRNNSKKADYKGIELKTFLTTQNGIILTLFNKFPNWQDYPSKSLKGFFEKYSHTSDNSNKRKFTHTISSKTDSAHGFYLDVDIEKNQLELKKDEDCILGWDLEEVKKSLLEKHDETFWVEAKHNKTDDTFRYNKITYTKKPNANLLPALIMSNIIHVKFSIIEENGKIHAHTCAFTIKFNDLDKLFTALTLYDLDV